MYIHGGLWGRADWYWIYRRHVHLCLPCRAQHKHYLWNARWCIKMSIIFPKVKNLFFRHYTTWWLCSRQNCPSHEVTYKSKIKRFKKLPVETLIFPLSNVYLISKAFRLLSSAHKMYQRQFVSKVNLLLLQDKPNYSHLQHHSSAHQHQTHSRRKYAGQEGRGGILILDNVFR